MRVALLALGLAACAAPGPEFVWYKPGWTQEAFDIDFAQCQQQAAAAVAGNPMIAAPFGSRAHNAVLLQQLQVQTYCLRGKGWQQVPAR